MFRNFFLLICVRSIVQNFLAFFRFTEEDACTILSAYGLRAPEVDRLKNNRPNEQEETDGGFGAGKPSESDRRASPGAQCPFRGDVFKTEDV